MRLATLILDDSPTAALRVDDRYVPLSRLTGGPEVPADLQALLTSGQLPKLQAWVEGEGAAVVADRAATAGIPCDAAPVGPLYREPGKIWGIGLNYREHAGDLDESVPEGLPGSFLKPSTTIIGPGDAIRIPRMSERTTAEAELGVVIGRRCKDVPQADWRSVVAGFTTIIDMTAEDILRRNPRFLTLSKSFDSFFVFGPELVTPDEVDDVMALRVRTVHNGGVHAENVVAAMTYPPDYLVALHSQVMTLRPGDVISTGTPGAVPIAHGDRVDCRIDGFPVLACPVVDEKTEVA